MTADTHQHRDLFEAFDTLSIDDLRRRGTAKWSYYDPDVLPAWVAEMDYPLAPVLGTALHEAITRGVTGYPPSPTASGLPVACAAWLARNFGLTVEPRNVQIVPDVLRGLALAIEAFSRPGSPVVVLTPAYPPFFETVRLAGREVVQTPLIQDAGRAVLDLPAIDAALNAGAATVLLCHPHNPCGRVFTREELAGLSAVVEAHGARVISDEAHAPLVYPPTVHVPYAAVSATAAAHSVTIVSASKGWNLPGLKCAQVVLTNQDDGERWARFSYLQTYGAGILGILANRVAFEQGEPWLRAVLTYLDGNRRLLAQLVATLLPGVRYTMPEATYLAWLDCRSLGLDDPAAAFLQHARVALSDGASFGQVGRGWVRLNFATSPAILTMIVEHMASALRSPAHNPDTTPG